LSISWFCFSWDFIIGSRSPACLGVYSEATAMDFFLFAKFSLSFAGVLDFTVFAALY
jgi:hypothetical protein